MNQKTHLKFLKSIILIAFLPWLASVRADDRNTPPKTETFKILTCNIRRATYDSVDAKTGNNWDARKGFCAEIILRQKADIICFQELGRKQFSFLKKELAGYGWTEMRGKTPLGRDPYHAIAFRLDRFKKYSSGGYWLSETPHVPGSRSWGSSGIRMAEWVRLIDKASGKEFRVLNTHLDHIGQEARVQQARMLTEDSNAYPPDYPQILTGDFNVDTRNPAVELVRKAGWTDSYASIHGDEDPGFTFHHFQGPAYEKRQMRVDPVTFQTIFFAKQTAGNAHFPKMGKMDWIFLHGKMKASAAEIIRDDHDGHYPSDHYFVSATVSLASP
ncbi:MAG TPA: endonuclease/exonuclease/phosphatase family protein [Chthoniobacteraceae bacterium]|nr:endonuclease/exonuclease/phosphatase family protein [Chthoniobacteraceae bacterium]